MDDEKKRKLKDREKVFDNVFYIVLIFVVVVVGFYTFKFFGNPLSDKTEDWGVFGDFIGGTLNPLLAFFSFMLLLLNLKLQREQLDNAEEQLELNRKELELTRIELAKAAEAQVNSAKVMHEQLKTQDLQQFENLFFTLISQLQNTFEHLEDRGVIQVVHEKIYLRRLTNNSYRGVTESIYCIIQNILDKFGDDEKNLDFQNRYINILKSIITVEMMHFLIRDAGDIVNTAEYEIKKEMINRFGLLSKISFDIDDYRMKFWLMKSCCSLFDSDAFIKNPEYLKLQGSKVKSIFYSRYPLTFEEALYRVFRSKLKNKNVIDDSFGINADDGTVIKFTKINEEIKISYENFELENFDFDHSKLSLIFKSLEHKGVRYTFDIYFDTTEDELVVENIFRIPSFEKGKASYN